MSVTEKKVCSNFTFLAIKRFGLLPFDCVQTIPDIKNCKLNIEPILQGKL